jgi:hypothetical protein
MFDFPRQPTRLHTFLGEHAEGLQNAALMLGGRPWLRRLQGLMDDVSEESRITLRISRELKELRALLHLEHVHDIDCPEAAYFAELDPTEPYVEEICLLADGLDEALNSWLGEAARATPSDKAVMS